MVDANPEAPRVTGAVARHVRRRARLAAAMLCAVVVASSSRGEAQARVEVPAAPRRCDRAVRLEAEQVWPVACASCPEGVTFAWGLVLIARPAARGEVVQRWEVIGDRDLESDLLGRLGACFPLALRALEAALRASPVAADPSLAHARRRILRWIVRRLPYRLPRGIRLVPRVERALYELASRTVRGGGRRLVVTSGIRDPYRQARAMFVKLILGARLLRLYRQKRAVREILRAYRVGRRRRESAEEVIARMRGVIEGQICRGVYVSEHLKAGAVDVRSLGLRARHKRALRRAVRSFHGRLRLKEERHPPHFHIAFRHLAASPRRPAYCPPAP